MANVIQNQRLEMYLEAERAVLSGQSYTIGNRTLTRASLAEIRKAIDALIDGGATIDGVEVSNTGRRKRALLIDGR